MAGIKLDSRDRCEPDQNRGHNSPVARHCNETPQPHAEFTQSPDRSWLRDESEGPIVSADAVSEPRTCGSYVPSMVRSPNDTSVFAVDTLVPHWPWQLDLDELR